MGRFYCGDIEGKFSFAVQDSDDIENLLSVVGNTNYCWHVCHCVAEIHEGYCRQCYDCKEEHTEATVEEGDYDDNCLYYEEKTREYNLNKEEHYEELLENMEILKKELPQGVIKFFENIEQNVSILNAFTGVFNDVYKHIGEKNETDNERHTLLLIIARYTMGYQIEYCLRTKDSCNITCEYY